MSATTSLRQCLLLAALSMAATAAAAAPVSPVEVVDAIESAFPATPQQRRNHTKGSCAAGEFVGNPAVAAYSRSRLFSEKPVPVVARFSISGGNPRAADTTRGARGMALQFQLPDGALQHMTLLNTPVFGAAVPETFRDLMLALRPDPATGKPDPAKLKAFRTSHPDSLAQAAFLDSRNPPAGYHRSAFFGIHSFRFIAADGHETLVRWHFQPQDGELALSAEEMKTRPADFLQAALIERLRQGPVRWDYWLTIGQPGDVEDDPTIAWPTGRKQVKAGTLSLHAASTQAGAACEPINFDPLVMADGIAPSSDPILRFRSPAYAVSFGRRLSDPAPAAPSGVKAGATTVR